MSRARDLDRLYEVLDELRERVGGYRYLKHCDGRMEWPERGVYFFFEPGETRENAQTLRVVRVGTHAVSAGSGTTLWQRLSQHKGSSRGANPGGGNHRGSIFRLHVGSALLNSRSYPEQIRRTWGKGASADRRVVEAEYPLERDVSSFIGNMPFLWVEVSDPPGPESHRKLIEANAVALLSNRARVSLDPPSPGWLGRHAERPAVRESGLWNVNHVDGAYDPAFLDVLVRYVRQMGA